MFLPKPKRKKQKQKQKWNPRVVIISLQKPKLYLFLVIFWSNALENDIFNISGHGVYFEQSSDNTHSVSLHS